MNNINKHMNLLIRAILFWVIEFVIFYFCFKYSLINGILTSFEVAVVYALFMFFLWYRKSLKLTPVGGAYNPTKNDQPAVFYTNDLGASNKKVPVSVIVQKDCTVRCQKCKKLLNLKKGDTVMICCGKVMKIADKKIFKYLTLYLIWCIIKMDKEIIAKTAGLPGCC